MLRACDVIVQTRAEVERSSRVPTSLTSKALREGYDFEFVTAFPADHMYLEKIRRESAVLEMRP